MKIKEGSRVRFIRADLHEQYPHCYPAPGTVGTVKTMLSDTILAVQWPKGSTSDGDEWSACTNMVEVVPDGDC